MCACFLAIKSMKHLVKKVHISCKSAPKFIVRQLRSCLLAKSSNWVVFMGYVFGLFGLPDQREANNMTISKI